MCQSVQPGLRPQLSCARGMQIPSVKREVYEKGQHLRNIDAALADRVQQELVGHIQCLQLLLLL